MLIQGYFTMNFIHLKIWSLIFKIINVFANKKLFLYTRNVEEARKNMKNNKKRKQNKEEDMTLVDCYYIPTVIAEQFLLLREHCATEVEKELSMEFPKVCREKREDIGEVVVAYNETERETCVIELSPKEVSRLEKEISAERLDKYLESKYV